jgi:cell division protein FtsQ
MAARKKTTTRKKTHYVRAKKRSKAESSAMARRSFSITVLVFLFISLVWGVFAGFKWINAKLYAENPRFEMQYLDISCDGKLTEDYIREVSGLREGTNLFAVSFSDIEEELLGVSRIESVYLERKLPNTLIMKVKERVAVARVTGVQAAKYPFLMDRYGYVLPHTRSGAALPLIKGIDRELQLGAPVEHPDVETALRIIALCDNTGYLRTYIQLESLDLKYTDFIDMRLKGGIRVRMPRYSLKPKLQNLATVIKIANGQGQRVKEVDLTLDSAKVPTTYY